MSSEERHWPGTARLISEVEILLLRVVQRRAAQDAAEDLIASGPDDLFEEEEEPQ